MFPSMNAAFSDVTIVVLGCRPGRAGALRGAAKRRVDTAARTFHELGGGATLVCSGGRAWDGLVEADSFARGLVEAGVPSSRIVRERCSMSTVDNARYTTALWARRAPDARGSRTVFLVTCEWHMPRAQKHFAGEGLEVIAVPAKRPEGMLPKGLTELALQMRERVAAWLDEVPK
jgi:uncharacterized SAM-binding protein YcdF (DUF218 family)